MFFTLIEWLHWQEHVQREARHGAITPEEWKQHDAMAEAYPEYEHPFMEADQIQHAKNKGEQTLLIANKPLCVDRYNAVSRTVYEFYGQTL